MQIHNTVQLKERIQAKMDDMYPNTYGATYDFADSHAANNLFQGSTYVQPKLEIGQPNDQYEQEADKVADAVVGGSSSKDISPTINSVQGKDAGMAASPQLEGKLSGTRGAGQSLPEKTQKEIGGKMGTDFGDVKVHTDSKAAEMSQSIGAKAFTHGQNIYFNKGQYNPNSTDGKHLLAHELTHTVQQGNGSSSKVQRAEIDTSMGCDGLENTAEDINLHVKAKITEAKAVAKKDAFAVFLDEVFERLGEGGMISSKAKVADWVDSLGSSKVKKYRITNTKYEGAQYGVFNYATNAQIMGSNMNINGLCVGGDKLDHFFQMGYEYYQTSVVDQKGDKAAYKEGKETEIGKFGLGYGSIGGSGIFSYADLAANKKGLKFYKDLADNWDLEFDIADYIDKDWSEEVNTNSYHPEVADKVWGKIIPTTWSGTLKDNSTKEEFPFSVGFEFMGDLGPAGMSMTDSDYTDLEMRGFFDFGPEDDFKSRRVGSLTKGVMSFIYDKSIRKSAVKGVHLSFDWREVTTGDYGVVTFTTESESKMKAVFYSSMDASHSMDVSLVKGPATSKNKTKPKKKPKEYTLKSSSYVVMTQNPGRYKEQKDNKYLAPGTKVQIIDRGDKESFNQVKDEFKWYKVKVLDGKYEGESGWVSKRFVQR